MSGPLDSLQVVLAGGIGPAPYCAMLLADMGAQVLRIERPEDGPAADPLALPVDVFSRGQHSIVLDLKRPDDVETAGALIARSDVLVEGFRPGVMERIGLGPDVCLERNAGLVYGRVTGWGRGGPLEQAPGHDINYIALTGALDAIGPAGGAPVVPLNLIGDFAGGGQQLATGILAALVERARSGYGQVIEAAMIDGVSSLMTMNHALAHFGRMSGARGENLLDGGAPFYGVYECADGRYIAVGAVEPAFYRQLLALCNIPDPAGQADRFDATHWPEWRTCFADVFRQRPRDEWCAHPLAAAACVSPVLKIDEVSKHPHHRARQGFVTVAGVTLPAPGPRFSRTACAVPEAFVRAGADSDAVRAALTGEDDSRNDTQPRMTGR
ncbi:CaiB/BaiF CoA transferase family protein [Burkholderia cenocepacia]|uniref:CaiB/BaiF CoA transferase family protein n=1 Tax=Burkholderia cenocepacia TaxID=95486 RepID=UPI002AB6B4CB|nr:CaiB/BaiF CoA-transferase family protein [Burkholderia cenocepacia]